MKKAGIFGITILLFASCASEAPNEEQQEQAVVQQEERDSLLDQASELIENADWGDEESDSSATSISE